MRRASIIGPILLILIGVLFLINNLKPELPILQMIGEYWPFVLIGWGLLRLVEITIWKLSGKPLPSNGISGGEWVLVIFLTIIGSSLFYANKYRDRWPQARINMHGLELLGESYDFNLPEQTSPKVGKSPKILIENWRGNARVVGADTEDLRVTGRSTVRAYSQQDADRVQKECPLEIVKQGDLTVIRTNQDRADRASRVSTDLEITVPKGASVEGRGRHGDFDVVDLAGNVSIDSDNAGIRVSNVAGNVRIETRRSDVVRAINVKGNVEVKGSGNDVELESIEGQAAINGSYSGQLMFRKLTKPLRFESGSTELRVERVNGHIEMSRGELTGSDVIGPVFLKARSKDIDLSDFTNTVEITVDRGDIQLRPGRLPLSKINASTRAGNVDAALPAAAKFELKASTEKGDMENDYGTPLERASLGRRETLEGKVGAGPQIQLHTDRGNVTVRKSDTATPTPSPSPTPSVPPKPPSGPKPPSVTSL